MCFLFVITLPDRFSICIVWITLYFSKMPSPVLDLDIVLPMVVCQLNLPKTPLQQLRFGQI